MSLFVGNISKNVRERDLEDEFGKFGRCTIKPKVSHSRVGSSSNIALSLRDRSPSLNLMTRMEPMLPLRISRASTWVVSRSVSNGADPVADMMLHSQSAHLRK